MSRNYRGDIEMSVIDSFMPLLMEKEDEGQLAPVLQKNDVSYVYVKHLNIFLVTISKKNANIAMLFAFLYKCIEVFSEYFKIVYNLVVNLFRYITQERYMLDIAPRPPMAVTNAVSWRSDGLKYRKNEVFLDVIESVNMLVGFQRLNSFKFIRGRGKAVELEDVKFHQCVRLSRFENDRTISFVPPDGEFELMNYRLTTTVKPLIWVEACMEKHAHSRIEYMVKAKSQFKRQSIANHVEVIIPVPSDADSPKFKTSVGSVKYVPELNAFVWMIRSFPGGREYLMRAHFSLPSIVVDEAEGKPPISVKFEIPYFTTSGLQVHFFKHFFFFDSCFEQ
ncbi:unnamed protein product [Gongylonema pulchrum]|uniref:MHD domain-containing protein n=1 Tax=Gongylonema pulchrum TaxID=637853 RepID=A0A183EEV6_9BILA|nr:unnamed protein product [Gongylonema pulchrum]